MVMDMKKKRWSALTCTFRYILVIWVFTSFAYNVFVATFLLCLYIDLSQFLPPPYICTCTWLEEPNMPAFVWKIMIENICILLRIRCIWKNSFNKKIIHSISLQNIPCYSMTFQLWTLYDTICTYVISLFFVVQYWSFRYTVLWLYHKLNENTTFWHVAVNLHTYRSIYKHNKKVATKTLYANDVNTQMTSI